MLRSTAAALLCVLFLAGCSGTSFLGQRYTNFTAYYNTFYNARKSFDRGVRALERTEESVNQDVFLSVYAIPTRAGNRQDFEDTIKRSADVIRDHPNSKWVDDAVLLIGKSYFYQQNFVSAAQKFREAIELQTDLEGEARFWLGYSLLANGSLLEARDELAASLDREELDPEWEPALNMLLGDVLVKLEEWEAAAAVIREGAAASRDRRTNARARFVLGQIEEMMGDLEAARSSYAQARRLQPAFELEFAAQISELRVAGELGHLDYALTELRRMERDAKYLDRRGRIVYTRGWILQHAGDARAAHEVFSNLLYGSDYDISQVRARIHYSIATLYRDFDQDFVLAAAHFDTAATGASTLTATSPGTVTRAEPRTVLAISDSREQADVYGTYARVYGEVARMDSLLYLGSLTDDEFQYFVRELRLRMQRELAERQREAARREGEAGFTDAFMDRDAMPAMAGNQAGPGSSAGFLFHRDPGYVQEGRQAFIRRWGDRPHVPGWRRRSSVDAYVAELRDNPDEDGERIVQDLMEQSDPSLPVIDVSEVPRTPEAQEKMRERRALSRYELGNVLFISINDPDSAAAVYQLVIDEDAELPVAGRAFYALAELERSRGRDGDADNLYRVVLERYPGSEFENRVREQLGLEVNVTTDSMALARARFDSLMNQWQQGERDSVFTGLIDLSLRFDHPDIAPAALMAATRVGVDWLRTDSLPLTDPLPVDLPAEQLDAAGLLWSESASEEFAAPDSSIVGVAIGFSTTLPEADSVDATPRILTTPSSFASATIELLLERLVEKYETSPLASQARSMISEIEDRKPSPATEMLVDSDSTVVVLPTDDESSDAAQISPDDTTRLQAQMPLDAPIPDPEEEVDDAIEEDVDVISDPATPVAPPDDVVFSLRGSGELIREAGGFTLLVADSLAHEHADELATFMREEGFRTSMWPDDAEAQTFSVYVGQFEQQGLAEIALRTHRDYFPSVTTIVPMPGSDSP